MNGGNIISQFTKETEAKKVGENSFFIIIAGILWGIIALFVKKIASLGFNSIQIVAIRCSFSAVFMVVFLLIKDKPLLKIHLKDLWLFVGSGVCSIAFFNFCYFQSIKIIGGAAVPALLLYTAPIFIMIMSLIFFGEIITVKKIVALFTTIIGMCLLTEVFSGGRMSLCGILYGIGAGFGYALYSIFGKFLLKKYNPITITVYTFITASAVTIPFSGVLRYSSLLFKSDVIVFAAGLALISTVLPFLLYTEGLKHTDAGKASILAMVEPFTAALLGALIWKENMNAGKILGMLLIAAAIIMLNTGSNETYKTSKS